MRFLPFAKGKKGFQFAGGGVDVGGGGGGGGSSAVMDYSTSEVAVGSYFGQTYYKRSFILNEDSLFQASTWVLLDNKFGIPSSFGQSVSKIVGYELTVDNKKVNNMSGIMYGNAGSGTGFYVLLQYSETYRENESILTIYYTK